MVASNGKVRIPVKRSEGDRPLTTEGSPLVSSERREHERVRLSYDVPSAKVKASRARERDSSRADSAIDWRDRALRLQAEMDNYRKRQDRRADEEILQEKVRLLRRFLEVVDNLEQALKHIDPQDPAHQGVQMAYDGMLNLLITEGVERIFAQGREFDPHFQEAVAVVPARGDQEVEMLVVEVVSPGYRLGDRVLRPAKVVVAKRGA